MVSFFDIVACRLLLAKDKAERILVDPADFAVWAADFGPGRGCFSDLNQVPLAKGEIGGRAFQGFKPYLRFRADNYGGIIQVGDFPVKRDQKG